MRKVMLLVAMLAMVLAAAVPALAQDGDVIAIDESDDVEYNAVCQNILGSVGDITQDQAGDANAFATDDSAAAAGVAQEQGLTIAQVNECLNEADLDGDGFVEVVELEELGVVVTAAEVQYAAGTAAATASAAAELPETGGASVIALGAGGLLVAGGLLARRIVR